MSIKKEIKEKIKESGFGELRLQKLRNLINKANYRLSALENKSISYTDVSGEVVTKQLKELSGAYKYVEGLETLISRNSATAIPHSIFRTTEDGSIRFSNISDVAKQDIKYLPSLETYVKSFLSGYTSKPSNIYKNEELLSKNYKAYINDVYLKSERAAQREKSMEKYIDKGFETYKSETEKKNLTKSDVVKARPVLDKETYRAINTSLLVELVYEMFYPSDEATEVMQELVSGRISPEDFYAFMNKEYKGTSQRAEDLIDWVASRGSNEEDLTPVEEGEHIL